ncbi:MFS transporter [Thalassotalea sp. 1_MG-2023]|uniref:MFS transporter n=1 Tax=Thalassotalea sp. 1_MG-2023 TaxID=3062680 RepID=UPI0026E28C94|nr:MFS transporter [Thalassotalea sp. 1_MG-2023]MDO6427237.1 MFS transporter [Thalassotalea sp. 1_MG-2023]
MRNQPSVKAPNKLVLLNILAFLSFVVVTTEFAMIGFLPEISLQLGVSLAKAGWFVTWFALGAAMAGPCLTLMVNVFDTKRYFMFTTSAFTLANVVVILLPHYEVIVVARFIQGGFLPVILSIIAMTAVDISGDNHQHWAISRVNLGLVIATVLGIPLSAFIAVEYNWQLTFLLLSILGLFAIVGIVFYFPAEVPKKSIANENDRPLLLQPLFLLHLVLSMLLFTAMFTVYTYISSFILTVTTFSNAAIGWLLVVFGGAGVVGNWLIGRSTFKQILQPTIYLMLIFFMAVLLLTFIGIYWKVLAIIILALWGATHMAAFVITQVRIMQVAKDHKAFALSLNMAICNLGISIGAMVGGWVSSQYAVDIIGYVAGGFAMFTVLIAFIMQKAEENQRPYSSIIE